MTKVVTTRPDTGRLRVQTLNDQPSETVQADVYKADIKNVLAQYEETGVMVGLSAVDLQFMDVAELGDFSDVMRQSREAEAEFMRLPSKIREAFNHDAAEWLDAAHDGLLDHQAKRLAKLGVLEEISEQPAPPAPPAPAPSPPGEE